MAKFPAVAALGEGGGGEGTFNSPVTSIEKNKGGIGHEFAIVSSYLDYHRVGPLARGARRTVGDEIAALLEEKGHGVVNGDAEMGEEEGVVVRHSLKVDAVYGKLKVGGGEAEGLPGVVGYREGLVESGSKGVKKRCIGGGGNRSVNNGKSN